MPTAEATLLPSPLSSHDPGVGSTPATASGAEGSVRHLEEVGVEAVLGAMIEQKRRASQPSYPAVDMELARLASFEDDDDDGPATERAPTRSEVFLKAR